MATYNYGTAYVYNYRIGYLVNRGYISAVNYYADTTINHSYISVTKYDSFKTENYGEMTITDVGRVGLRNYKLKRSGVLKLGGIVIRGDEALDPELKNYLQQCGLSIQESEDGLTLDGTLRMDIEHAKNKLPHLFSKYSDAGKGYEYLPGAWFSSSYLRVANTSKRADTTKYWRYEAITKDYDISAATTDVFAGKLAHELLDCTVSPKVKFDVFSKGVVTRDVAKGVCVTDLENDHFLLQYITKLMVTEKPETLNQALVSLTLPTMKETGWLFSLPSLFFSSSADSKNTEAKTEHNYDRYGKPSDISKQKLKLALDKVISAILKNDFQVCETIRAKIYSEFQAVNTKFSPQEINEQVMPKIDDIITNLKRNVAIAQGLIASIDRDDAVEKLESSAPRLAVH